MAQCVSRHSGVQLFVQKWSKHGVFCTCWLEKCLSHHSGVQFFGIRICKTGPGIVCFVHLTWKCFSHHIGVHFFHVVTSQKWPEPVSFLAFWLQTAFFCHSGVQFFISALATRLRRFSEPTFRPSWPTNPSKTRCLATVVTVCAPAFFFLTLSLSLFYPSVLLFSSTLLFPLCFSSVHTVGSFLW